MTAHAEYLDPLTPGNAAVLFIDSQITLMLGVQSGITGSCPGVVPIDRVGQINAMDDPRFAEAVKAAGRRKVMLAGVATDFCLVYPALTPTAAGDHVFIAGDASGSWTSAINDAAMARLPQLTGRLGAYTPAPAIISENSNHTGG